MTSSRPSTIDHRPSTIDHRPSTIDHRPSTIDHRPSTIDIDHRPSARREIGLVAAFAVSLVACTVPNPTKRRDAGGDDAGMADAMLDPKEIVRVSPSGKDGADGVAAPVKTIKRAIEIATGNGEIKMIRLEAGKYGAANGEKYPYTVPTGVKLVGAPGTILAGTTTEAGLVVDTGAVENLELSDFTTALHATSTATLTSITVKTSKVGLLADGSANVKATGLTFVGDSECKTIGLQVLGNAHVAVESFVSSDALSVDGRDQATVSIANATISAKPTICFPQVKMNGKSLTLTDTTITGGQGGIWLNHDRGVPFTKNPLLNVQLLNTTIADAVGTAIISEAHEFQMTDGEIRNNRDYGALLLGGGVQTFTGVASKGNFAGIATDHASARVKVRGCTITGNMHGVVVNLGGNTDLGTAADPGNNTILNSGRVGLLLENAFVGRVLAAGNTWKPNTDGSDANGKYGPQVIVGSHNGGNFIVINPASSIQL